MSWQFLTILDPQVDVAFACDLRQSKIIPIQFEHKLKSNQKILKSPKTLQFGRNLTQNIHDELNSTKK